MRQADGGAGAKALGQKLQQSGGAGVSREGRDEQGQVWRGDGGGAGLTLQGALGGAVQHVCPRGGVLPSPHPPVLAQPTRLALSLIV